MTPIGVLRNFFFQFSSFLHAAIAPPFPVNCPSLSLITGNREGLAIVKFLGNEFSNLKRTLIESKPKND
jgi:hypothetical protein